MLLSLIFTATLISQEIKQEQLILICSCGEVAAFGAFQDKGAFLDPANVIPDNVRKDLRRLCHEKSKITVWHTERLTGKACPVSL